MKVKRVPTPAIASLPTYTSGGFDKKQPCALVEWNGFPREQPITSLLQAGQRKE
jgi:hypothetical protein